MAMACARPASSEPGRERYQYRAVETRSDRRPCITQDLFHIIAETLNGAARCGAFSRLVLVAPPETLQAIKAKLDDWGSMLLVGELAQELVALDEPDLRSRLSGIQTRSH